MGVRSVDAKSMNYFLNEMQSVKVCSVDAKSMNYCLNETFRE